MHDQHDERADDDGARVGRARDRRRRAARRPVRAYQRLTPVRSPIAASASRVKASTERWPKGTTMNAASSGPSDCPKLPPT